MTKQTLAKATAIKSKIEKLEEIIEALNSERKHITYSTTGEKTEIVYREACFSLHLTDSTYHDRLDIPKYLNDVLKIAITKEKQRLIDEFAQL